jgi:hypothetical protein
MRVEVMQHDGLTQPLSQAGYGETQHHTAVRSPHGSGSYRASIVVVGRHASLVLQSGATVTCDACACMAHGQLSVGRVRTRMPRVCGFGSSSGVSGCIKPVWRWRTRWPEWPGHCSAQASMTVNRRSCKAKWPNTGATHVWGHQVERRRSKDRQGHAVTQDLCSRGMSTAPG